LGTDSRQMNGGYYRGTYVIFDLRRSPSEYNVKKPKVVSFFQFKDLTYQQVVTEINKELPINLKHNEELVDRIHKKYPILTKTEISIIVKAVFQSLRDLLLLGKVLNFNTLFFDTKLYFFTHLRDGNILPALKVQMSTPPPLRKI
jgi:hypothetical protein